VDNLRVEVAGETLELQAAARSEKSTRQARGGTARRPRRGQAAGRTQPEAQAQPTQKIEVKAGDPVIVRSTFRTNLPMREGRFVLQLPAVAGGVQVAETGQGPPTGSISVRVHHEEPLLHAESPTHDVLTYYEGNRTVIELSAGEDRSSAFELELAVGAEDDASLVAQVTPTDDGYHDVVAVLTPPMQPAEESVRPKQVLFVVDTSGSMGKAKLPQAREALATCLEKLRPDDQLNLIRFNTSFAMMAEAPVGVDEGGVETAMDWLSRLRAGGGTQLLPALLATFEQPVSEDHHRMIVLLTDGALQDRKEVLEPLEQKLGDARLFVIGIGFGKDVSRDVILRLAEYGRGTALFAEEPEALNTVLAAMFESVSDPLAWDLELDLGGAQVESMSPSRLPDLYAGRPVTIHARVKGDLPGELKVEARTSVGTREFITILTPGESGRLSGLAGR
jgi:Ca-activated chloride channel family protein